MATVKMAISSGDSTSFLYSVQKVAENIYHALTFYNGVSDDTLDILVGLCAGRSAVLQIERTQTLRLFKRLSASQTHTSVLDDETWAVEVGGSIVGEIEGQRSCRTPWAEPNFGVKFRYRRRAEETVSDCAQDPKYSALLKWNTSTSSLRTAARTVNSSSYPMASSFKLQQAPLPTPPNNSTSKHISHLPRKSEYPCSSSLITPPTSPTLGVSSTSCGDTPDDLNTLSLQILSNKPKASSGSPGLFSMLFSKEEEQTLNNRTHRVGGSRAGLNQPKPGKRAKRQERVALKNLLGEAESRIPEVRSKENNDGDSDVMDSFEVKQKQMQQLQRLQRKVSAHLAECQRNVTDHKANKPQPRPVKIGGATRGVRVAFREREPTRRRVARGAETDA